MNCGTQAKSVMPMLDQRGQLLRAAVGFAGCSLPSYDRALWALRTWLDAWTGIGPLAVRLHRQGYDLQLAQYDECSWRATFYISGMEHSPTGAIGTSSPRARSAQGKPDSQRATIPLPVGQLRMPLPGRDVSDTRVPRSSLFGGARRTRASRGETDETSERAGAPRGASETADPSSGSPARDRGSSSRTGRSPGREPC
jgi:hypothetical protein